MTSKTKMLFWFVFGGTKGGHNRIRIISLLRKMPLNSNQLSTELSLDYNVIKRHIRTLEKNNIVTKFGGRYDIKIFVSALFRESEEIFDDIVSKLTNKN